MSYSEFRPVPFTEVVCDPLISRANAQQYLTELGNKTRLFLDNQLGLEELPNTLNEHYFHDYKRKMISKYDELHQDSLEESARKDNTEDDPLNRFVQALKSQSGFESVSLRDVKSLKSINNEASIGIEIMAEVRAYFQGK